MQPIERYGLIALLFLVVTVVAVVLWDRGERRTDGALAKDLTAAAEKAAPKEERPQGRSGARVAPESTRGTPPASSAPRAGLVRLPTENVPAPAGQAATAPNQPTAAEAAVASHGGVSQALDAQRATLASIAALRDPVQQELALRAELRKYPEHSDLLMQMFREEQQVGRSSTAAAVENTGALRVLGEDPRARSPITVAASNPSMGLAPMTVEPTARGQRTYTVRAGDTLGEISQRELGTARRFGEILALNPGLDERRLVVGRTLVLPPAATAAAASPAPVAAALAPNTAVAANTAAANPPAANQSARPTAADEASFHIVQAGESLFSIAAKRLGDGKRHREIATLNPSVDPSRLLVGQRLRLPAAKPAATVAAAPPIAAPAPQVAASATAQPTRQSGGASRVR